MVVRLGMKKLGLASANADSVVSHSKGIPIEEAGSAKEVARSVQQGKAFLKIVQTPWGVEFYVYKTGAEA
jgi:hypothetical protein